VGVEAMAAFEREVRAILQQSNRPALMAIEFIDLRWMKGPMLTAGAQQVS
jgi:hypothetical protein